MKKVLEKKLLSILRNSSLLQDICNEPNVYSSPPKGRNTSGSVRNLDKSSESGPASIARSDLDRLYGSLETAGVLRVDELTNLKALLRRGKNCYSTDKSGPSLL